MLQIHTVAPGQTLFSIAGSYGVSPARLAAINGLREDETLAVGQSLVVIVPERYYTLQRAMTEEELTEELGLTLRELQRCDRSLITDPELYAGRTIALCREEEESVTTVGYAYPFIDPAALSSALPFLSELALFTYGFDRNGDLVEPEADDTAVVGQALRAGVLPVLLLSTLGEDGRFNSALPEILFDDPDVRDRLIDRLLTVMREKGYRGLDVDFEYIRPDRREDYASFIGELTAVMNENGYPVTVALAPKTSADQPGLLYEAHDYRLLGEAANRVLLMTYEWGYTYGPPQAVAPIDKVAQVLNYALTEIPAEKILLGVPNYGYDWTLPYTPGTAARSLSTREATDLAVRYGADIRFDRTAASPYFYYTDGDGRSHLVYFEDARSFAAKLDLISENRLGGYGVWTVMRPSPALFAETAYRFSIR